MNTSNIRDRVGQCYVLAGRMVIQHLGTKLVHGRLRNPHHRGLPTIDHAWVEDGDLIYDPVLDETWPMDAYLAYYQASVTARYGRAEVLQNTNQTGHWGPW